MRNEAPANRDRPTAVNALVLALLLGALAAAFGPGFTGLAAAKKSPTTAKARVVVRRALVTKEKPKVRLRCRTDPAGRGYVCRYRTRLHLPTGAVRACRGKARPKKKAKAWRARVGKQHCRLARRGPAPVLGFNEGWAEMPDQIPYSSQYGARIARVGVAWEVVEKDQGEYDWSSSDEIYHDLLGNGVQPLLVLMAAPEWARDPAAGCPYPGVPCAFPPLPSFYPQWQHFASLVAARYPQAAAIEVWNEPNFSLFWAPGPDPKAYADVLTRAYQGIKGANPQMPVISAGLVASSFKAPEILNDASYLQQLYDQGAGGSFDALGAHPYPIRSPSWPESMLSQLGDLRRVAVDNGDRDKVFWLTEVGISTTGDDARRATEPEQAAGITDLYKAAWNSGLVTAMVAHRWRDIDPQSPVPSSWDLGLGLMRVDGTTKPAFCAFVHLTHQDMACPDSLPVGPPSTDPDPLLGPLDDLLPEL